MASIDAWRLFDAFPDAAVAADASQQILLANKGVERLLGWSPADLAGRQLSELIPPPHQMMELDKPVRVMAARPENAPSAMAHFISCRVRQRTQDQTIARPNNIATGLDTTISETYRNGARLSRMNAPSSPATPSINSVSRRYMSPTIIAVTQRGGSQVGR